MQTILNNPWLSPFTSAFRDGGELEGGRWRWCSVSRSSRPPNRLTMVPLNAFSPAAAAALLIQA
jgi:hypothetical protein